MKTIVAFAIFMLALAQLSFAGESAVDLANKVSRATAGKNMSCVATLVQDCLGFLERVKKNKLLSLALEYARKKDVFVGLADGFFIGNGLVNIDVNTSDETIIKFFLGK